MLKGRNVLLGITGGVAAYKAAYLARRLVEQGAVVRSIMTESAGEFLGPQTIAAVTGEWPHSDMFGADDVSPHTSLARWADVIVVAPATAASLARIAHGLSSDLLSSTILAATCPVVLAPAMHTEMWEHPATQRTVRLLNEDGHHLVGPESGALAGGDDGPGRLSEPDTILEAVDAVLGGSPQLDMKGWRVVVSSGGTREPIDPVRYIGNRSSGKMGNAIAVEAARRGADVVLVTAAPAPSVPGIEVISVERAAEMAEAVWSEAAAADVAVMAAAVADFRPADPSGGKLRRAEGPPDIELEATPDILAGVAAMDPRPFLIGFAAETGSIDEAVDKARRKGVDLLVANDVARPGSGFGTDTNEVTLVLPDGTTEPWELMTKAAVASHLWDRVITMRSSPAGASS
jgi:phosphopantothenoylcysteine decarboxylase/phosphopantothenate--cysteine ligase